MKQLARLSHKHFLKLDKDPRESARTVNLVYVTDTHPGIERKKKGKSYVYTLHGKPVTDEEQIARIKKLAIPPSWTNVWICPRQNGHIQATGLDMNGRKQYRYHANWTHLRNETKFHRLYEFGKALPQLRRHLRKDLSPKDLTEKKVLATVINLMEQTYIRIGSNGYEKLYGSHGITTLKDKHVTIKKEQMSFSFVGKKGIEHAITIKNKRLANIIKQCRDLPGKELFQYLTPEGEKKCIDSGSVNNYIKEAAGNEFTAKDFRTWAGTLQALKSFSELDLAETEGDIKKNIVRVLDAVSEKLGNSRSICKKYYVHPGLIRLYEEKKLLAHLKTAKSPATAVTRTNLSAEEKVLMKVLKQCAANGTK